MDGLDAEGEVAVYCWTLVSSNARSALDWETGANQRP